LRHISVFAGNAQGWEKRSRAHHITGYGQHGGWWGVWMIAGCGGYSAGISGILHQGNGGSGDAVAERQSFGSNHLQPNFFALLKDKSERIMHDLKIYRSKMHIVSNTTL